MDQDTKKNFKIYTSNQEQLIGFLQKRFDIYEFFMQELYTDLYGLKLNVITDLFDRIMHEFHKDLFSVLKYSSGTIYKLEKEKNQTIKNKEQQLQNKSQNNQSEDQQNSQQEYGSEFYQNLMEQQRQEVKRLEKKAETLGKIARKREIEIQKQEAQMYLLKQAMEYLKLVNQAVLIKLVEFSKSKKRETVLANINPLTIEKLIQLVNPNINLEELTAIQLQAPQKGLPGYLTNAKVTKRVQKQQENINSTQTEFLLKEALKLTVNQNQLEEMLLMQEVQLRNIKVLKDFDVNEIIKYNKEEMEQFIQSSIQYMHQKNRLLGISLDVVDLQAKFNQINKETEGPRETLRKLIVETSKTTQKLDSVPMDPNFDLEKILKEKGMILQSINEKNQSNAGYIMQSMLKDFIKSRKNYFELQDELLKFSRFQTIDIETRKKKVEKPKEIPKSDASTGPDTAIFNLEVIITQAEQAPELEKKLESLKKINDELTLKYEVNRKKYQELEYSKDRVRLEFEEFQVKFNDLDNQNTVLQERLKILEEKFYKKKNKMRNFKRDILKVQQTQFSEQNKQKESQLNQYETLETKIANLEKSNASLTNQKDSFQQKLQQTEKSLSDWIDKYNKLLEEILDIQQRCQNQGLQLEKATQQKLDSEMKLAMQQQNQKKLALQLEANNQLLDWQSNQNKQLQKEKEEKEKQLNTSTVENKQAQVEIQPEPMSNNKEQKEEVKQEIKQQKKSPLKVIPNSKFVNFLSLILESKAQQSKQIKQPNPKKIISQHKKTKFETVVAKQLVTQSIQTEVFSSCDQEIQVQPSQVNSINQSKLNESNLEDQQEQLDQVEQQIIKQVQYTQTNEHQLEFQSGVYSVRLILQKTIELDEKKEEIIQSILSYANQECQTEKGEEQWQVYTNIQEKENKIQTKTLGIQVKIENQNKNKRTQTKALNQSNQYIQTDELFASNLNSLLNETTDAAINSSPRLLKHEDHEQIKEQVKLMREQSLNKHTKELLKVINRVNNTYLKNLEFDLTIKSLNAPKRDDISLWRQSKQKQKMEILERKNKQKNQEKFEGFIKNSFEKPCNSYFKEGNSLEEPHSDNNTNDILTHSLIKNNDSYLQYAYKSQKNLNVTTTTSNSMHQALEIKSALMKKAQMLQKPLLTTREIKKKYPFKQLQSFQQLQNSLKFLESKFTSETAFKPNFMTLFPHQSNKHNQNFHYLLPSLQTPRPNCLSLDESYKPDNSKSLKSFFKSKQMKNDYQQMQCFQKGNQQKESEQNLKHYFPNY